MFWVFTILVKPRLNFIWKKKIVINIQLKNVGNNFKAVFYLAKLNV